MGLRYRVAWRGVPFSSRGWLGAPAAGGPAVLAGTAAVAFSSSATGLNFAAQPLAGTPSVAFTTTGLRLSLNHALAGTTPVVFTAGALRLSLNHALSETEPITFAASASGLVLNHALGATVAVVFTTAGDLSVSGAPSGAALAGAVNVSFASTVDTLRLNHALAGAPQVLFSTGADLSVAAGPAFRTSWISSLANPLVITFSGGTVAGDILLAYAAIGGIDDGGISAGWTRLVRSTSTVNGHTLRVWYKIADGTETSVTITSDTGSPHIGGVLAYSGRSTSAPPFVASPVNGGSTSTSTTTLDLSITPAVSGTVLVFINGTDVGNNDPTRTFSTQSGTTGPWTTRTSQNDEFVNATAADSTQAIAGTVTGRITTDLSGGQCGILIALGPAGSQPPSTDRGAGRSSKRRKRRLQVEIDRQVFAVDSEEEAEELIAKAREIAEQQAAAEARQVVKKRQTASRREKKPLKLDPVTLSVPYVKPVDQESAELAQQIQASMDAVYASAARDAELALHMHIVRMRDEEETIISLLLSD